MGKKDCHTRIRFANIFCFAVQTSLGFVFLQANCILVVADIENFNVIVDVFVLVYFSDSMLSHSL